MIKGKILLAESNPISAMCLKLLLSENGFEVIQVTDSEKIVPAVEKEAPHLVMMNVVLRGGRSFDAAKKLQSIPVLFLSARNDQSVRAMTAEIPSSDLLCMPYQDVELMHKLNQLLMVSSRV